jgi:hypothetical protein
MGRCSILNTGSVAEAQYPAPSPVRTRIRGRVVARAPADGPWRLESPADTLWDRRHSNADRRDACASATPLKRGRGSSGSNLSELRRDMRLPSMPGSVSRPVVACRPGGQPAAGRCSRAAGFDASWGSWRWARCRTTAGCEADRHRATPRRCGPVEAWLVTDCGQATTVCEDGGSVDRLR